MLRSNSKLVCPGDSFIAVRGAVTDGNRFVPDAIAAGAATIYSELPPPPELPPHVSWHQVPDSREAVAALACAEAGHPSHSLRVVGVTGTNGKTTVANLIRRILSDSNLPCALASTIENDPAPLPPTPPQLRASGAPPPAGHGTPSKNTTAGPIELQALFSQALALNAKAIAIEVSSHALDQKRVDGTRFACSVFTNLTQDHLDYHGSMEAYFQAKKRLFASGMSSTAALSIDDPYGRRLLRELASATDSATPKLLTYGFSPDADVCITDAQFSARGSRLTLRLPDNKTLSLSSKLLGRHNALNSAAALAAALLLGVSAEDACEVISRVAPVCGRLERISSASSPATFFVDYAHTPDALSNVLKTLTELPHRRIITVFGAGGDRDKTKRPLMAEAVAKFSDYILVTSDNPRSENPAAILQDVLAGIPLALRNESLDSSPRVRLIENRADAIRLSVSLATSPEDIVLIAGKGHENYQIIGNSTLPFDDRDYI